MQRRCADCEFGSKTGYYRNWECRRHAPVVDPSSGFRNPGYDPKIFYPIVDQDHWCGDFESCRDSRPEED